MIGYHFFKSTFSGGFRPFLNMPVGHDPFYAYPGYGEHYHGHTGHSRHHRHGGHFHSHPHAHIAAFSPPAHELVIGAPKRRPHVAHETQAIEMTGKNLPADASTLDFIAKTAYGEDNVHGLRGLESVMHVMRNLASLNPNKSIQQIVNNHPNKFNGSPKFDANARSFTPTNHPTLYAKAIQLAREVWSGQKVDFTHGATHFHMPNVSPNWDDLVKLPHVEGLTHIFYRYNDDYFRKHGVKPPVIRQTMLGPPSEHDVLQNPRPFPNGLPPHHLAARGQTLPHLV